MKKKNRWGTSLPGWLDNLIIKERVFRWKVSERLQAWTARLQPRTLRLYFLLFVLLGGMVFSLELVQALGARRVPWNFEKQTALWQREKTLALKWTSDSARHNPRIRNELEGFWRLADSIHGDGRLAVALDSVLKVRPGFLDTLSELEKMYPREENNFAQQKQNNGKGN